MSWSLTSMVVWGKLVRLHIPTMPNALTVTAMPAPTTPTISQAFCTVLRSAPRRPNAPFRSDMAATSANCCQDGPNCGPTGPPLAPTSAQLGPNMPQLNPKSGPFESNSSWAPYGFDTGDIVGPTEIVKTRVYTGIFHQILVIDDALFEATFLVVCLPGGPTWCEAVEGSQIAPLWTWLGIRVHHIASIWVHPDRCARFRAGMLVSLGAAAGCRCRVLLSEWCVHW